MEPELLAGLREVFRNVFGEEVVIEPAMQFSEIDLWDSLTHMMLIAEVEKHFSVQFTFEEVMGFTTVEQMIKLISDKKS